MARLQNSFSKTTVLCLLLLSSCFVCEASLHKLLRMILNPQNTCQSNRCQMMTCPELNCRPDQVMKYNADWGGCPKCVTQLQMGNPCQQKPNYPWPMPSSECCQGLKCKQGKCCK